MRTPDRDVYQIRAGNYVGQNFGVVTNVGEGEIKLKELIQDGAGDWTERSSTLQLQQAEAKPQQGQDDERGNRHANYPVRAMPVDEVRPPRCSDGSAARLPPSRRRRPPTASTA